MLQIKRSFVFLLFNGILIQAKAQHFINSSVPRIEGNMNNAMAIQFKSIAKCLDVQTGIAVLNGTRNQGYFSLNCQIDQSFNKLGLKFYPNPVDNMARLQFLQSPPLEDEFTISAWNTIGKRMYFKKELGSNLYKGIKLELEGLAAGTYILVIESSKFLDAIKFIKND